MNEQAEDENFKLILKQQFGDKPGKSAPRLEL